VQVFPSFDRENIQRKFLIVPHPENHGENESRGLESGAILLSLSTLMKSSGKKPSSKENQNLVRAARKAMTHAYAPYSHFRVGAAFLTSKGELFSGCNVENASYGLSNCAERTAIFAAIAQLGPKLNIRAVAVVNDQGVPCSPCGACRQVIYEFGPDATIFFQSANGWKESHITELLPEGFRLK
jgi:cytidine deaminase